MLGFFFVQPTALVRATPTNDVLISLEPRHFASIDRGQVIHFPDVFFVIANSDDLFPYVRNLCVITIVLTDIYGFNNCLAG